MCRGLIPCNRQSERDCKDCYRYGAKIFSPEDSFKSVSEKLYDCIIECDGFYMLIEIKKGRVNSGEAKDAIAQLKNCEGGFKEKCGINSRCGKILLYESFDMPPAKRKRIEKLLEEEHIKYYSIKNLKGKKIC